jgi:hypothetical protein
MEYERVVEPQISTEMVTYKVKTLLIIVTKSLFTNNLMLFVEIQKKMVHIGYLFALGLSPVLGMEHLWPNRCPHHLRVWLVQLHSGHDGQLGYHNICPYSLSPLLPT